MAPASAILLTAAPLPTVREIQSKESVGKLPLLPYTCMSTQCFLWTMYGVLQGQTAIWLPNVVGTALGLYFFLSFVQFAPKRAPSLPGSIRQHVAAVVGVTAATLLTAAAAQSVIPKARAARTLGLTAMMFAVALFASPLSALKTVFESKSAATIPLPFTIMSVINCSLWLIAGFFKLRDFNVILPNILGLTFGLTQVGLRLKYGSNCMDVIGDDDPYCILDYDKLP